MTRNNYAFIDAQNLHLATTQADKPWTVDLKKFRVYLQEKYCVSKAYYFLGVFDETQKKMYEAIQRYGYILVFREHGIAMKGKKKGNVDVDIVFSVMKKLYKYEYFENVIMVSGDGDYKRMIDFLIEEGRFETILLPNARYASSLYKHMNTKHFDYIDRPDIRVRFELVKRNWESS
jgi:uncharacterized LabA/DUF88 family protein